MSMRHQLFEPCRYPQAPSLRIWALPRSALAHEDVADIGGWKDLGERLVFRAFHCIDIPTMVSRGGPTSRWKRDAGPDHNRLGKEHVMADISIPKSGIYCIRNTANGKVYVGSAINF